MQDDRVTARVIELLNAANDGAGWTSQTAYERAVRRAKRQARKEIL